MIERAYGFYLMSFGGVQSLRVKAFRTTVVDESFEEGRREKGGREMKQVSGSKRAKGQRNLE